MPVDRSRPTVLGNGPQPACEKAPGRSTWPPRFIACYKRAIMLLNSESRAVTAFPRHAGSHHSSASATWV